MSKKLKKLLIIIITVILAIIFMYNIYSNKKKQSIMEEKLKISMEKYNKLKLEKEKLQNELEEARIGINNEKIARDQLNMKKDGERVYKIVEEEIENENVDNKENSETKEESR